MLNADNLSKNIDFYDNDRFRHIPFYFYKKNCSFIIFCFYFIILSNFGTSIYVFYAKKKQIYIMLCLNETVIVKTSMDCLLEKCLVAPIYT